MKTVIKLIDRITNEVEKVEDFNGVRADLNARLYDLQEGYCEDEKPVLQEIEKGNKRILLADSNCDFNYFARIK